MRKLLSSFIPLAVQKLCNGWLHLSPAAMAPQCVVAGGFYSFTSISEVCDAC